MLTLAVTAYVTGALVDRGISPRTVAIATGFAMLLPAGLWAWAMGKWRRVDIPVAGSGLSAKR
jgi:hypothetical protein